jgi:hypothetical protein
MVDKEVKLPSGQFMTMTLNPSIPPQVGSSAVTTVKAKIMADPDHGPTPVWAFEFGLDPAKLPFGDAGVLQVDVMLALTRSVDSHEVALDDEDLRSHGSVVVARTQTRGEVHVVTKWPEALVVGGAIAEFRVVRPD